MKLKGRMVVELQALLASVKDLVEIGNGESSMCLSTSNDKVKQDQVGLGTRPVAVLERNSAHCRAQLPSLPPYLLLCLDAALAAFLLMALLEPWIYYPAC